MRRKKVGRRDAEANRRPDQPQLCLWKAGASPRADRYRCIPRCVGCWVPDPTRARHKAGFRRAAWRVAVAPACAGSAPTAGPDGISVLASTVPVRFPHRSGWPRFDKTAPHYPVGVRWFGYAEIGTVTAHPARQPGPPAQALAGRRPRPAEPDGVQQSWCLHWAIRLPRGIDSEIPIGVNIAHQENAGL